MTRNLPLVMIDEPGSFDPIETWEQFLAEVQAMPDFHGKAGIIDNAEWLIRRGRGRAEGRKAVRMTDRARAVTPPAPRKTSCYFRSPMSW